MRTTSYVFTTLICLLQLACTQEFRAASPSSTSSSQTQTGDPASPSPQQPSPVPVPLPPVVPVDRSSPSPGNWVNVTSNLANMNSECGNLSYVSAKPTEDLMIASVALQGLWGSRNGGATWSKLGMNAGSATITSRTSSIVYDPIYPSVFYTSGIYNGNGIHRTDNAGGSFTRLGTIDHNDSVSVDFTDPMRRTILAGTHERYREIHRSADGGMTWTNIGDKLPDGYAFTSFPLVINSTTYFAGLDTSYSGRPGGIFQTNDSGNTWFLASAQGGGSQPLFASDGSIYWPGSDGSMMRGTGAGSNWTWTQTIGSGTLRNVHPVELPGDKIASLGGQRIMISSDRGVTWQAIGPNLPFNNPVGLTYSPYDKSIYIWQFNCGPGNIPVMPNAIMKYWLQ